MPLSNGVRFIWVDQHIGRAGAYLVFRSRFQDTLEEAVSVPPDALNVLIWALEQNLGPFLFVHKIYQAIKLIKAHHDKQIILISSASMGKFLIPRVSPKYGNIYRYYIFCQNIQNYINFFYPYADCLLMFNHETDLLARLARDISKDIIQQGKDYIEVNDPKDALKCYELALTLNIKANQLGLLVY